MKMSKADAVAHCWDLVNKDQYLQAEQVFKEQSRRHGRRAFEWRLRLIITNGVWLVKTHQI